MPQTPRNLVRLAVSACLLGCAMNANSGEPPPGAPAGWGTLYSEYNIPKSIYVPGDPILLADANKTSGPRIAFTACPVLRDSQPTPLWMARYNGELYFLRAQQNFSGDVHHPQLGHQVLVEGIVSQEPRIGGGIVLTPLNISVMRELDSACNEMLPSEGYKVAFAKRPPGPGNSGEHRESRNIDRAKLRDRLDAVAYKPDAVPNERREFVLPFDFDSDVAWSYPRVVPMVKFARDVNAARIEIHSYRGSVLLSNGTVLNEREGIDQVRADKVRAILQDYTLPQDKITIMRDSTPAKPDGVNDFANRKVVIVVIPPEVPATTAQNSAP